MSKLPSGCSLNEGNLHRCSIVSKWRQLSRGNQVNNSNPRFFSQIFKLTWTRRDDFVLFLFSPRPPEPLSVPSTGWEESFSTLPSRIFTFPVSSSIHSFELRTVWSSSSIELWQASRPVINCCVVSREDRGVDPLDWTEDDDRPTELTRELEPL